MNVLKPHKKAAILTLAQNKISQHEIAAKTGIDRKTIRKYQKLLLAPMGMSNSPMATGDCVQNPPVRQGWPPGLNSTSACFAHHEFISTELKKGRNAMAIYQDLVERFGFMSRYNSVKRYVHKLKQIEPLQFDRLEFLPGEEAQVDYGQGAYTLHPKTGKRKRPRLFVMTLRCSRKSFRKVVWNSSQETWAKLHEEAFRFFGGCPQYVVLDNLLEGVLKPDIYEPELNPVYAAMLVHYGVVADPCRVCDPDRKGTVESAIQHTQNTALKGREFNHIDEQNQWLMHWEECWASQRIHGRTKRQVAEMFIEEKPFLKPLPLLGFRYFEQGVRTVWDDGCIEVKGIYYPALPAPLYSKVLVRIYELEIEIFDKQTLTLIRRHIKGTQKGFAHLKESDRIFNPSRQTRYFLDQAEKIGPNTKELCDLLFAEQGRLGQRRMRGIVSLAKRHSADLIELAAKMALERCVRSSKTVRELVERLENKAKEAVPLLPEITQSHELIRKPSEYALFWEAHTKVETKNKNSNQNHKPQGELHDHVHD